MAIAFQVFGGGAGATGSTVMSFSSTVAGSLVVGIVRIQSTTSTLNITDNQSGNTWVQGPHVQVGASDTYFTFYGLNLNVSGSNAINVTVSSSNSGDFVRACGASYSGIATTSALDKNSSNTGSGTSWTSTSVTTTSANEVVVNVVGGPTGNTFTADGAFNNRGSIETDMFLEDKIVSATGSFSPTVTVNTGGNFGDFLLTFADTPISGDSSTTQQRMVAVQSEIESSGSLGLRWV